MLSQLIPMLSSFLPMFTYVLWLCFGMAAIAAMPGLIRRIFSFV